ncbi:MAG: Gfo/Idh/MocA family oxidoreductase, partial [Blastocatellia bacterium]|nr:Gfo/Idh/MocA family oxidoreductase [Blastocatellia bacterium]
SVILTASTSSNDPVKLAGEIARDRGRVVVVGAVKMDIPREHYYMKELELCLSRSYGPGRYDPSYEEWGFDYPIGYVRWTEKRNMEEVLRLMAAGKLNVELLTTNEFKIDDAAAAYDMILGKTATSGSVCGVLLKYDVEGEVLSRIATKYAKSGADKNKIGVGFIGAGNFATASLLPHLRSHSSVLLTGLANSTGVSAKNTAERFRFNFCASSSREVIEDSSTDCVFIATRHNLHAPIVVEALSKGRSVFVEKPLCLNEEELKQIVAAYKTGKEPALLVGFNRRFSPLALQLKKALGHKTTPYSILYRVNAGFIAKNSWIQDPIQGGGRIVGEVCHFIDLMQYFTDAEPVRVFAESITTGSDKETDEDTVAITVKFSDGSVGTVHYIAVGDKSFPKEYIEIFGSGTVAVLDDFKSASLTKNGSTTKFGGSSQDKGHKDEVQGFIDEIIKNNSSTIQFRSLVATTLATFKAVESLRSGKTEVVELDRLLDGF